MKLKKIFIILSLGLAFLPTPIHYMYRFGLVKSDYFRDLFISTYIHIKSDFLEIDPIPEKTREGKNDWYFLGNWYNNVISKTLGVHKWDKIVYKEYLEQIGEFKQEVENDHCKLYFTIAPNKHKIYPEYLPWHKINNNNDITVSIEKDLLSKYGMKLIDLKETLLSKKGNLSLYYRYDSHWNEYGAFWGAQKIIDEVRKDFPVVEQLNLEDYHMEPYMKQGGDLVNMIQKKASEKEYHLIPKVAPEIKHVYISDYLARTTCEGKPLKVVFIYDSCGEYLQPFLSSTFGEVFSVGISVFSYDIISEEKPDIVIFEIIERNLVAKKLYGGIWYE